MRAAALPSPSKQNKDYGAAKNLWLDRQGIHHIAYKTATKQTVNLVLNTIGEAKEKEKVTAELQLCGDQGVQYTSHGYFKLTKEYGITPSMSRRGNPYDNALAENFFSILKTECIYRIKLKTKLTPSEQRNQFVS